MRLHCACHTFLHLPQPSTVRFCFRGGFFLRRVPSFRVSGFQFWVSTPATPLNTAVFAPGQVMPGVLSGPGFSDLAPLLLGGFWAFALTHAF